MAERRDRSGQFEPLRIKHPDRAEIFSAISGLPPWLDGPRIKALAKREGITYARAQKSLEKVYG